MATTAWARKKVLASLADKGVEVYAQRPACTTRRNCATCRNQSIMQSDIRLSSWAQCHVIQAWFLCLSTKWATSMQRSRYIYRSQIDQVDNILLHVLAREIHTSMHRHPGCQELATDQWIHHAFSHSLARNTLSQSLCPCPPTLQALGGIGQWCIKNVYYPARWGRILPKKTCHVAQSCGPHCYRHLVLILR